MLLTSTSNFGPALSAKSTGPARRPMHKSRPRKSRQEPKLRQIVKGSARPAYAKNQRRTTIAPLREPPGRRSADLDGSGEDADIVPQRFKTLAFSLHSARMRHGQQPHSYCWREPPQ